MLSDGLQTVLDRTFTAMKRARDGFAFQLASREVGTITTVSTGIATVTGLRGVGFEEISVSSHLAPLARLVPRADTTVLNAYLGPVLRGYLDARQPDEDLRAYFARTDDDSLRAQLAGTVVDPVERDAPPIGAGRHAPGE